MKVIRRGLAFLLDFAFLSMLFFPVTYVYSGKWVMSYEDHYWGIFDPICAVFLAIIFAYFIFMEAYTGGTAGKRVLGLRVTDADGGRIGLKKAAVRNLLRVVDGLPAFNVLAIVLIAVSPTGQRFGDRVAKTCVVSAGRGTSG